MSTNPSTASGLFSVTVTKPGHGTVRVGPFIGRWTARGFAQALDHSIRHVGAPADTTLDVTPYDQQLPHRCVPATDSVELARQMDQEPDHPGPAGYPDLFTRLCAHQGWETAARAWLEARSHHAQTTIESSATVPPPTI
ncbi:hypothetical protein [Streptomyces nigrescens]|uniref:hypothetical protein n=1 Tax=Streptomyces nigrescens TaxID=1920 RepID=UPI0036F6A248